MKKIFILFLCLSTSYLFAQTTRFSLEECIHYAKEHNITLKSAELNKESSEIQLKTAKNAYAPSVSASLSQGFGYSHATNGGFRANGNYGINAGMTLFDGLNTQNNIKQAQLNVTQADYKILQAQNNVNFQIIEAFLSVLMNQELLDYQEEVVKKSFEQMEQGKQQFKVGQILESDYLMLESQYLSDSFNIENTKIAIENNLISLKNILCIGQDKDFAITKPTAEQMERVLEIPELQELITKTLGYYPSLKISENAVDIAEYDIKMAKSNYYPSLSLSAGISTGYTNNNTGFGFQLGENLGENLGLSLNIPIYNRSNTKSQVNQAKIRKQQAELDLAQEELNLVKELQNAYQDTRKALNNYQLADARAKAYQASFQAYNEKFKHGAITAADLLQQQTNYLNYLNTFIQNKYTYILDRKILDIYMGVPIQL
ncbi:MAG: TolC family protein [Bacteroidales bacterium]|nr:TolC family protein [Bacteroidales bacterium]